MMHTFFMMFILAVMTSVYAEDPQKTGDSDLDENPMALGHGKGFLQRVRNESEFPISFYQEKTIHDYLPEGTIVRIRSLRKEYGPKGRYLAVRQEGGAYRLKADTNDPNDPAVQLVVGRYVARDFSDYIGFYSNVASGKYIETDPSSRTTTFSGEDVKDERFGSCHWKILAPGGGSSSLVVDAAVAARVLEACYLKSRNSGYLQIRGTATKTDYPGLSVSSQPTTGAQAQVVSAPTGETSPQPLADAGTQPPAGGGGAAPAATESTIALTTVSDTGTFVQIKLGTVGAMVACVGISAGVAKARATDGAWRSLSAGAPGAGNPFVAIDVSEDFKIAWAADQNGNTYSLDLTDATKAWVKSTSVVTAKKIAIAGNGTTVVPWVIDNSGGVQKKGASDWERVTLPSGVKAVDIAAGSDGTVMIIGNSGTNKLYIKKPADTSFALFYEPGQTMPSRPSNVGCGKIDQVVFSTNTNDVFVLKSGASGAADSDWKKIANQLSSPSIGSEGSLIGLKADGKPIWVKGY